MSKSFKVILEEHNNWINEARIELMRAAAVKDAFTDNRICELDSDIENLEQDLENEQALTAKLKGKLDGRDELLRELVNMVYECIGWNWLDEDTPQTVIDNVDAILAKAKEVMP